MTYEDPFATIAPFYDHLMRRIKYADWANYIERLFARHELEPHTLLDLACGTGTLALEFAQRGYEVVGVDASAAMIKVAREKAKVKGLPVRFEAQLAQELELEGTFDAVISVFDSLNYLLDADALGRAFARVATHLVPQGAFVFDMNAEAAFTKKLFDQDNLWDKSDNLHFKWRGTYNKRTHICTVNLRFVLEEAGRKQVIKQVHRQRAYPVATVQRLLWEAGLELLEVYNAYTLDCLKADSDRAYYIAVKREARGSQE